MNTLPTLVTTCKIIRVGFFYTTKDYQGWGFSYNNSDKTSYITQEGRSPQGGIFRVERYLLSYSVPINFTSLTTIQKKILCSIWKILPCEIPCIYNVQGASIDGLHLTSWRPCWRYNTKEYVINSIVGSSWRGWLTLSAISREIDCKPRIIQGVPKKVTLQKSSYCYNLSA